MYRRAYRRYERDELPADALDGQDDIALVTERFETLCAALESLPDKQRRAILLREWRGLSYSEIAEELNVSHAAVETMLFRARRSLVKQFGSLALFPVPSIGRFVRWIAGPGSVKAATMTAVAIGAATAVVSSSPVEPVQPVQLARTKPTSTLTFTHQTGAPSVRPTGSPASTQPAHAPVVGPSSAPAEPRVGEVATGSSTPEAPPIETRHDAPTSQPVTSVVDLPIPLPPVSLPVDPAEPLAPVAEITNPLTEELEQLPQVELPPLVPALPLP
jgi:hypothetical protein